MKSPHHNKASKARPGMTLIEITVVILVMFSLIAVLFVGAKAWKRGSDRSGAIIVIRGSQMGMRAFTRIEDDDATSFTNLPDRLFGQDRYVANGIDNSTGLPKAEGELPDHPVNGLSFDFVAGDGDIIPALGTLYICTGGSASVNDYTYNPNPGDYQGW